MRLCRFKSYNKHDWQVITYKNAVLDIYKVSLSFRKLKNRVAAQTARDRKKQHMTEIEDELVTMQLENNRLAKANKELRHQSITLRKENSQLRARLAGSDVVTQTEHVSPESAVLSPPQQESIHALFHLTTHCLSFLLTMRYAKQYYMFICLTVVGRC